ncbi:hypothetical protein FHS19_006998 [Paenibacillus rhizosphaerae]|uniref:Lipoprotein n=1 Tax=Paenibacillus rhizosphaerae TaxID=297318 RepID=A0A839U4B0_9BACL|nr:hypothetical protein [Paenibacillus rhizosphaerae]MBB3132269.1 hypothetical protein [Paenibacillus rhizosphaerae]
MKSIKVFIFLLLTIVFLSSCSAKELPQFNDKDLKFNLIDSYSDFGNLVYDIEVQNTGKLRIGFLKLYIYYPIKEDNGSRSNPFKIEGKTDMNPTILETNEKTTFHIYAPIKDVFGDSALLDFENPVINFEGAVLEGDKEIPFSLGGSLDLIMKDH